MNCRRTMWPAFECLIKSGFDQKINVWVSFYFLKWFFEHFALFVKVTAEDGRTDETRLWLLFLRFWKLLVVSIVSIVSISGINTAAAGWIPTDLKIPSNKTNCSAETPKFSLSLYCRWSVLYFFLHEAPLVGLKTTDGHFHVQTDRHTDVQTDRQLLRAERHDSDLLRLKLGLELLCRRFRRLFMFVT